MTFNEAKKLYRESQIDQLTAESRDNPDDVLLADEIEYIMSLHKQASLLEQKIIEIDEMIAELESYEDEI